jgi:hypothetical protein
VLLLPADADRSSAGKHSEERKVFDVAELVVDRIRIIEG